MDLRSILINDFLKIQMREKRENRKLKCAKV